MRSSRSSVGRSLRCLGATATLIALVLPSNAVVADANVPRSPNPSWYHNQLFGVEAISATDAWAVGDFWRETDTKYTRTMALHWNGVGWSRIWSPSPGYQHGLYDVSATSSTDVWAVGTWRTGPEAQPGRFRTLVLHWDGTAWSRMTSPSPTDSFLFGVEAISSQDVWAVGNFTNAAGQWRTLTLHWDGVKWARVWSPSGKWGHSYVLNDVAGASSDDVWAVGDFGKGGPRWLLLHWNGEAWSRMATGVGTLRAVDALAVDDAWAVGVAGGRPSPGLILRWNGVSWTRTTTDQLPDDLFGVVAVTPSSAWAVGTTATGVTGNEPPRTLAIRWDGSAWSRTASPNPGDYSDELLDVSATSPTDVWAVGRLEQWWRGITVERTLILHWDGSGWTSL